jgi:uncharacterized protein YjbJ (UPF0337 family)
LDTRRTVATSIQAIDFRQLSPPCKGISMNKDQVKGRVEQAKGSIKETTGKVVGNENLEAEGKLDKAAGKTQATYGDLKEDAKDAIKKP